MHEPYYGGNTLNTRLSDGRRLGLTQTTEYPWQGDVRLELNELEPGESFAIRLIPYYAWANPRHLANDGLVARAVIADQASCNARRASSSTPAVREATSWPLAYCLHTMYTLYATADVFPRIKGHAMRFQTLRQQAYISLRQRLVSGELAAGTQLNESTLAVELSMSRTPIREAIRQMEMEGLVEYTPRFGATVRVPERDELAEMYTVREALESYAAAEAALRISEEARSRLEQLLIQMKQIAGEFQRSGEPYLNGESLERFLCVDLTFHQTVIGASGNRYISRILDGACLLARLFRSTLWIYDPPSIAEANRFHERLLEALRQRDAEEARSCTIEALKVSKANALKRWDEQQRTGEGKTVF